MQNTAKSMVFSAAKYEELGVEGRTSKDVKWRPMHDMHLRNRRAYQHVHPAPDLFVHGRPLHRERAGWMQHVAGGVRVQLEGVDGDHLSVAQGSGTDGPAKRSLAAGCEINPHDQLPAC
jgi:hypothetical protein